MEIWTIGRDWETIIKRIIIAIEIITIIILLSITFQGKGVEAVEGKYFIMLATAYYPGPESCHPFDDGFTATGAIAGKGCVAIDPDAGILKMGQNIGGINNVKMGQITKENYKQIDNLLNYNRYHDIDYSLFCVERTIKVI